MDTANTEQGAGPVTSLVLSYPKGATLEQRVARLERLCVAFIMLAGVLSVFVGILLWLVLNKFGVI